MNIGIHVSLGYKTESNKWAEGKTNKQKLVDTDNSYGGYQREGGEGRKGWRGQIYGDRGDLTLGSGLKMQYTFDVS